jgi:DNA primase
MLKREVFKKYNEYSEQMEEAYEVIKSFYNLESDVEKLCEMRGYLDDDYKELFLQEQIGVAQLYDSSLLGDNRFDLGMVTESDYFLLQNRWTIPIRDIQGNLSALVGWYPDTKKYITTPSLFFAKEHLFYNIDEAYRLSWDKYNGLVFLVEGMFDCMSLRVLGLPAISTMGVTVKSPKSEQLKLFRKVVAIPDGDKAGKRATNKYDKKYGWEIPNGSTMVKIESAELQTEYGVLKVKDIDNIISYYEHDSVRDILLEIGESKEEVITMPI